MIIQITTSIGIAIFPKDKISDQELIKQADQALYNANTLAEIPIKFTKNNAMIARSAGKEEK